MQLQIGDKVILRPSKSPTNYILCHQCQERIICVLILIFLWFLYITLHLRDKHETDLRRT